MKKFNFKLYPVLKYREHLENIAKQEYVKAYMDVKTAQEMILQMEQAFQILADKVDQETITGISSMLFRQYNDYLDSLESDIELKRKELEQLQRVQAVKQQALTKKSVAKKVIERLREKKRGEYLEEFQAEEQKRADDIASLKKAREASENVS
ncbi:MAG: flagellar export protein FliJ [Desulfamplus sp.]|nr:flagellar export protein FliJ [Desulfamplus sp.]